MWIYIYIYAVFICVYIYIYVLTVFLHAAVNVDEFSSVFPLVHQEISSVFLICLIILINGFDQFSKPIWSVYHKKNVSHLFVHFVVWFISRPKFSQSIFPVDHYSLSSVLQSFPNLLVHVIVGFHQFFPPIFWVHHDVSWVLVVRSFIVSLDFINFPHQSLHCTIHFHQFSPTYLWFLSLVTRFYLFSPTTCSFYHWRSSFCPSIPWFLDFIMRFQSVFPTYLFIFSLGFISFPHILAHLITSFYWVSPFFPFIRGFHHVPVLLQCVYYANALSLSNLSIISSI